MGVTMPNSIPAVAYYRMSSDKQETSIPDQRVEVQAYAAKHGKWLGGPPPYGYALADGRLVLGDPQKAEVVCWLFRSYARGEATLRGLARQLNERGVPSPGGGRWSETTVHKVLQRPTYTG